MPMIATSLTYEVAPDEQMLGAYRVEAIDSESDGEVYVAIFSGPDAESKAKEYAAWKNRS